MTTKYKIRELEHYVKTNTGSYVKAIRRLLKMYKLKDHYSGVFITQASGELGRMYTIICDKRGCFDISVLQNKCVEDSGNNGNHKLK